MLFRSNYGSRLAMSARTRETIHTFWESIDFIVNSMVFLLIGIELQVLRDKGRPFDSSVLAVAGAVFVAIQVARAAMVYPLAWFGGRGWPAGWKHVLFWSGLKGSIPLALVLGLPPGELRNFLAPITFIVVLVSLLLQGLTIPVLIRVTGVQPDEPAAQE